MTKKMNFLKKKVESLSSALKEAELAVNNQQKLDGLKIDQLTRKTLEDQQDLYKLKSERASMQKREESKVANISPSDESYSERNLNLLAQCHSDLSNANNTIASLTQRNETLVKEIRFADQTCVEISEQKSYQEKEIERLEHELEQVKYENENLHDHVIKATMHSAKLEAACEEQALKSEGEKLSLENELKSLKEQLFDSKSRVDLALSQKVDKLTDEKNSMRIQLTKSECMSKTNNSRKATKGSVSCPPSSEKNNAMIVNKNDDFDCFDNSRTPTSTVLAKTLQYELQRNHEVHDKYCAMEEDLMNSKHEINRMNDCLKKKRIENESLCQTLEASRVKCAKHKQLSENLKHDLHSLKNDLLVSVPSKDFLYEWVVCVSKKVDALACNDIGAIGSKNKPCDDELELFDLISTQPCDIEDRIKFEFGQLNDTSLKCLTQACHILLSNGQGQKQVTSEKLDTQLEDGEKDHKARASLGYSFELFAKCMREGARPTQDNLIRRESSINYKSYVFELEAEIETYKVELERMQRQSRQRAESTSNKSPIKMNTNISNSTFDIYAINKEMLMLSSSAMTAIDIYYSKFKLYDN